VRDEPTEGEEVIETPRFRVRVSDRLVKLEVKSSGGWHQVFQCRDWQAIEEIRNYIVKYKHHNKADMKQLAEIILKLS
jgi:hypothetical protein